MERRTFLESCLALSGTAGLAALPAWADVTPRLYERTKLVDIHGAPLKARALVAETNYIFHYPFVATPCFLLNLGRPAVAEATLRREDGTTYAWNGGVGPGAGDRRVFGDLRAQARVPDARRVVHPLSAAPLGDVRRAGDPLLRRPQRLRSGVRRARAGGTGAAAARRHPARLRSGNRRACGARHRGRRAVRRLLREIRIQAGARARPGEGAQAGRGTAVVRELAQYCKQTIQC